VRGDRQPGLFLLILVRKTDGRKDSGYIGLAIHGVDSHSSELAKNVGYVQQPHIYIYIYIYILSADHKVYTKRACNKTCQLL